MITEQDFIEATKRFDVLEKRGSFYNMAVNLMNSNFQTEAYFLILATWNFAVFRYAVKDFDIHAFRDKIRDLDPYFVQLEGEDFRSIDFKRYKDNITRIFEDLSSIEGVKYTGASKLMHLRNRNVFVMWDGYIKGNKSNKYYNKLDIVRSGGWKIEEYGNDGQSYLRFLVNMQERFKDIHFQGGNKTFAKAIDEFNYVNITLPIQNIEKEEKNKGKKEKKNLDIST
ncbi:MAG: hypothetical protein ACE144_12910 [Thermodesulfobacteriota bacterium]